MSRSAMPRMSYSRKIEGFIFIWSSPSSSSSSASSSSSFSSWLVAACRPPARRRRPRPRVLSSGAAVRLEAPAPDQLDGERERGLHAAGIGDPATGDVERRPVVGRRADERQPERDVHRAMDVGLLDGDQALVVVHRDHGVAARTERREQGVGRNRPECVDSRAAGARDRRGDDALLLVAIDSAVAGVRVERGDGDPRDA
jgi:hypothetical protein